MATATKDVSLNKKVSQFFWRSWAIQASWNYERQMNMGFLYGMVPTLDRLYPDESDPKQLAAKKEAYHRHMAFYNCTPQTSAFILGLAASMEEEYAKGNYVIAGGDFNQTFPGGLDKYPIKNADLWTPGTLDDSMLPDGWHFAYDTATPTCRLDNQPYDAESDATQHYVIDGFILSPNVELTGVQTQDDGFRFSDHNPVLLNIRLK